MQTSNQLLRQSVITIKKRKNLLRLDESNVNHLFKYAMFDKEQKKGYKPSARNLTNWHYDDKEDSYTHPDGGAIVFTMSNIRKHRRTFNRKSRFTTPMNLN
nr:hypothetical protein [Streptococcus sp. S784/96/1]